MELASYKMMKTLSLDGVVDGLTEEPSDLRLQRVEVGLERH